MPGFIKIDFKNVTGVTRLSFKETVGTIQLEFEEELLGVINISYEKL